ncbi:response regulator [Haliangium ochraceum]|uniref:Response regulator receiver protein n=1 Tax=Haliangium ochraceum (strain DSM 14365 / JCM 11303 / SMP-2) TaxID=502025 RepID=D0LUL6_HALO1|nr:response regulator [Haliangium ochraceum]ACY19339.1 response regulator receiver protein [Haliangium ochraceum DSM 14365]
MSKTAESGASETILVVDDDPEILGMLDLRLGKRGYRVVSAIDGEEALEQARKEKPALVVLDVMMPRMNGWEVARALRQDQATSKVKIVMLTAIGAQMNEMTSPLYGVDAYLDKPFEFSKLEQTIADLLA